MLNQWQFNGFSDFLFLNVEPPNIFVSDIWFFFHEFHGAVGFWWQDIYDRMRMSMQGDARVGFQ
jgi:hypothetical protein